MGWFNKKNKKDEDYDDELEDDEEESRPRHKGKYARRLASKNFKDLNPSDSKKRKEPPKPWGKKERGVIFFLILLTAGVSGYLGLSARDYKLPGLPRLKTPLFAIPGFLKGETIVIEGNREENNEAKMAVNAFEEKTRQLTGVYGLYVSRLLDDSNYGVNEDEVFVAASLIKLPVMVGLYKEREEGRLNLNTKYTLKNSDKIGGSGSLQTKPAGYEITYKNLIKLMGQESDNTAFNIAKKYLGGERIKEIIEEIGMSHTNLENNETTPRDIGIFFEKIWNGKILNSENKEEMLGFLTNTIYEDYLPAGLPSGVRIAHKYGRETHVLNDAGIVYADSPYVIVILSKAISDSEVDEAFPELSRIIYNFESGGSFNEASDYEVIR